MEWASLALLKASLIQLSRIRPLEIQKEADAGRYHGSAAAALLQRMTAAHACPIQPSSCLATGNVYQSQGGVGAHTCTHTHTHAGCPGQ